MRIITVINAKGGCGKSTIAMNVAAALAGKRHRTLLIDMDPQAQVTSWLNAGDGLRTEGTLTAAMVGREPFLQVVQQTPIANLEFVASSEGLEELGRMITEDDSYPTILSRLLTEPGVGPYEFVVIDSPNQISPIMENAIFPADLFVVPFESTKAVKSFANFYKLLLRLRPQEQHQVLHVLSNLTRQSGLRNRVIEILERDSVPRARTEIRSCGWLAQVDEHGGSIFTYRPASKGAQDMLELTDEILAVLNETGAAESEPDQTQVEGVAA
ncbi:MAG TPA: ParA family protein [Tepidisphaeraceae bacterium]|jgi:chromosome partitioning protein|nr:ParA family protein [Tepidisphaeraceae bacterium]